MRKQLTILLLLSLTVTMMPQETVKAQTTTFEYDGYYNDYYPIDLNFTTMNVFFTFEPVNDSFQLVFAVSNGQISILIYKIPSVGTYYILHCGGYGRAYQSDQPVTATNSDRQKFTIIRNMNEPNDIWFGYGIESTYRIGSCFDIDIFTDEMYITNNIGYFNVSMEHTGNIYYRNETTTTISTTEYYNETQTDTITNTEIESVTNTETVTDVYNETMTDTVTNVENVTNTETETITNNFVNYTEAILYYTDRVTTTEHETETVYMTVDYTQQEKNDLGTILGYVGLGCIIVLIGVGLKYNPKKKLKLDDHLLKSTYKSKGTDWCGGCGQDNETGSGWCVNCGTKLI